MSRALTTVPLNPGSGGTNVDTITQTSGAAMPVSALAVSPDGVSDEAVVTGINPLPVGGATLGGTIVSPTTDGRGRVNRTNVADLTVQGLLQETNRLLRAAVYGLSLMTDIDLLEATASDEEEDLDS